MRAKTRAVKCLNQRRYRHISTLSFGIKVVGIILTMGTFLVSPRRSQSWRTVRMPTQAMVKSPTHFMLTVIPRPIPVLISQNHQLTPKAFSGPCSCWFVKALKARAVKAVAAMRGESRRIRRA